MSPEQLQGQEADARSDIFALGCVLYEMLTGRRAFEGKSQVSIMAAILEHEPTPLTEPTTPAWLDRIIRRCLRKNPNERWQNARDIAIELREPPPLATPLDAPAPGRLLPAALASVGVLGALVAVWALFFQGPPVPKQAQKYTQHIPGLAYLLGSMQALYKAAQRKA